MTLFFGYLTDSHPKDKIAAFKYGANDEPSFIHEVQDRIALAAPPLYEQQGKPKGRKPKKHAQDVAHTRPAPLTGKVAKQKKQKATASHAEASQPDSGKDKSEDTGALAAKQQSAKKPELRRLCNFEIEGGEDITQCKPASEHKANKKAKNKSRKAKETSDEANVANTTGKGAPKETSDMEAKLANTTDDATGGDATTKSRATAKKCTQAKVARTTDDGTMTGDEETATKKRVTEASTKNESKKQKRTPKAKPESKEASKATTTKIMDKHDTSTGTDKAAANSTDERDNNEEEPASTHTKKRSKQPAEPGQSTKKARASKGKKSTAAAQDEESQAQAQEQEQERAALLAQGYAPAPAHCSYNNVYSNVYRREQAAKKAVELVKQDARRASQIFRQHGLISPELLCSMNRKQSAKPAPKAALPKETSPAQILPDQSQPSLLAPPSENLRDQNQPALEPLNLRDQSLPKLEPPAPDQSQAPESLLEPPTNMHDQSLPKADLEPVDPVDECEG